MASPFIAAVPKFVVFEYGKKYLTVKNDTDYVKFDGEDVHSQDAKFELELESSNAAGTMKELVHIRSCYNNKYLVINDEYFWVSAGANNPEEDQSIKKCTLFKIEDGNSPNQFAFRHAKLQRFVAMLNDGMYLGNDNLSPATNNWFTLVDWDSLLVLPKRIAFKDRSGNYLRSRMIQKHPYHQFADGDTRDQSVEYEAISIGNGLYSIKSIFHGKYWRRSPNWIWADSTDIMSKHVDVLFEPVKIDHNAVALRNMGNNLFCKSLTLDGKKNCLNASEPSISTSAELVVEEYLVSRTINHVDYDLSRARVYGEVITALATTGATNESYESEIKNLMLGLNYKDIKSNSWNHSISVMAGVSTKFQAGIPLIVDGQIEVKVEATYTYEWGKTKSTEVELVNSYTVTVPPRTKTKVTMIATMGSCDVPFSYNQTDTFFNGEKVTKSMKDGIYVGSNYFNFDFTEERTDL